MPSMWRVLLVTLVLSLWAVPGEARRKPAEKYHVEVTDVEAPAGIPATLPDMAKQTLARIVAGRPEFVATLEGAPDKATQPEQFKTWLRKKKLRAFQVVIKLTEWEVTLLPPKEGKKGQILQVHVALSLLGTGMPDSTMAMAGDGTSTVKLEIGAKLRPRDQEVATQETLQGALASAVEDAVQKLQAGPRTKPQKK